MTQGLTPEQFDAVKPGDEVWLRTGNFTASLCRVLDKDGNGATRRLWLDVLHPWPGAPSTRELNEGRGLPVSYRSVYLAEEDPDRFLQLYFTPDAIRDHFEADDEDPIEGLTDDDLRVVGEWALTDEMVYKEFHSALVASVEQFKQDRAGA